MTASQIQIAQAGNTETTIVKEEKMTQDSQQNQTTQVDKKIAKAAQKLAERLDRCGLSETSPKIFELCLKFGMVFTSEVVRAQEILPKFNDKELSLRISQSNGQRVNSIQLVVGRDRLFFTIHYPADSRSIGTVYLSNSGGGRIATWNIDENSNIEEFLTQVLTKALEKVEKVSMRGQSTHIDAVTGLVRGSIEHRLGLPLSLFACRLCDWATQLRPNRNK